jgi:hypothetical protein
MLKIIKKFFSSWQKSYDQRQKLEDAYRWGILYDKGKISKETFERLLRTLNDRGKANYSD